MQISLQETLIYYDGPQLFVAADHIGTQYLCVLFEQDAAAERCLCVPISARRLADFNSGDIDLRSIYERPEMGTCLVGSVSQSYDAIGLEPVKPEDISEAWLPEEGFYFQKTPQNAPEVQKIALEENRAIIDVSVDPPEARGHSKISPSHLIDVLESFQLAIKYSYRQALQGLKTSITDEHKSQAAHRMHVAAFAPGSFKIRFESQESGDMLGCVHLSMALRKLDELTLNLDNPQAALEVLKQNGGHLASAYMKLLETIIENDAPFSYSWGVPDGEKPVTRQITRKQAIPLYELFKSQSELTRVEVDRIGWVIKANVKTGTWTLQLEEDRKEVSGRIHEESTQDLGGIVLETVKYKFTCLETIEETAGTGRRKTNLHLIRYSEVR